jgi:hypothetical protein
MNEWTIGVIVVALIGSLVVARNRKIGALPPGPPNQRDLDDLQRRNDAVAAIRTDIIARRGEDLKPDDTVGGHGLITFNGMGIALFGRSDFDPATDTFVATKWLMCLLPLLPLGRYRVHATSAGFWRRSYIFIGRVPLRPLDWVIPACWGTLALLSYACSGS